MASEPGAEQPGQRAQAPGQAPRPGFQPGAGAPPGAGVPPGIGVPPGGPAGQPWVGQPGAGQVPGYGYPMPPHPPQPGRYPPYGPSPLSPSDERLWGTLAHIGGLVVPFASLIVFLVYKDRSPFVRLHSCEALNFHISLLIYEVTGVVAAVVLAIVTAGIGLLALFPLLIGLMIFALVTMILGAVAASKGRPYRYPLTIRLVP